MFGFTVRAFGTFGLSRSVTSLVRHAVTPLPDSLVRARPTAVIVFGGSFDPVHRGHTEMAAAARDAIDPDAFLLFVPAARSPFKPAAMSVPSVITPTPQQRAEMLHLATRDLRRAATWSDEIDRAKAADPSYTIDTLTRLRSVLDAAGLQSTRTHLLIGADQAIGFHRWREAHQLMAIAEPIVMVRGLVAESRHLRAALAKFGVWSDRELDQWTSRLVQSEPIDASSTAIRTARARGDQQAASRMLDPHVLTYITTHGLYAPA